MTDFIFLLKRNRIAFLAACFILLSGVYFRFYGLKHGLGAHPDERGMIMITGGISWDNLNPKMFAYGSLPFYLLSSVAGGLSLFIPGSASYDGLMIVGRVLSVLLSSSIIVATGYLAWALGLSLLSVFMAMALAAWNPFFIQNAHFYTVDTPLALFSLLTLICQVRYLQSKHGRYLLFMGIAIGAATATKIAGLSLFLPTALVLYRSQTRVKNFAFVLLVAALSLFVFQPFTFLDFSDFYHDVMEQLRMVAGEYIPPYTVQYIQTWPYLYHLKQMFFYTLSPVVMLFAGVGLVFSVLAFYRRQAFALFVLTAWMVAVFFSIGGQFVKFPRYLLPIYPVLFILAAYGVECLTAHKRRWVTRGLVGLCLGWALFTSLAFLSIYRSEHTWRLASRWIFENLPLKANILGEHWDDRLPQPLPGYEHNKFQHFSNQNTLGLYEPDTEEKMTRVAAQLAQGDYMVLATPRLYGSILPNPDRFPLTTKYFAQLFAGDLGYEVIRTFQSRPEFAGLRLDDSLADESLSVYDHPKVVVLQNKARKSAEELKQIIISTEAKAIPYADIMRLEVGEQKSTIKKAPLIPTYIWHVLIWYGAIFILGLMYWRIHIRIANHTSHDYGLAKTLGLGSFGLFVWLLQSYFKLPMAFAALTVLGTAAVLLLYLEKRFPQKWIWEKRTWQIESIFALSFLLCLFLKAWRPEIFSGEKPMDFTFLNYFARDPSLPPQDPWASGQPMKYYYFGSYLFALLCHLLGTPTSIGYNLALALILPLTTCGLMALLQSLIKNWRFSMAAALIIALGSNWDVVWQAWFLQKIPLNFDLFWATSRVFKSAMANEYPLWSFLFGDLHAHVIAVPFAVAFISVFASLATMPRASWKQAMLRALPVAICLSLLLITNTWDFIFASLFMVIFAVALVRKRFWQDWRYYLVAVLSLVGFSLLFSLPFILSLLQPGPPTHSGIVFGEANTFFMALRHFGCFLVPASICWVGMFVVLQLKGWTFNNSIKTWAKVFVFSCIALSPLTEFVYVVFYGYSLWATGILLWCVLLSTLGAWIMVYRKPAPQNLFMSTTFIYVSHLITISQLFWVSDHMNWQFKIFVALWGPVGILGACGVAKFLPLVSRWRLKMHERPDAPILTQAGFYAVGSIGLFAMLVGSLLDMGIMTTHRMGDGPRPTLDGTAYLKANKPMDVEFYAWLKENVSGTPIILEAQGRSYGDFNRVGMFSGLPAVLGWEHHVKQRGLSEEQLLKRKNLVQEVYATEDVNTAKRILDLMNVSYLVVGKLERETYPESGLAKFSTMANLIKRFENREIIFYEVMRQPSLIAH